MKRDLEIGCCNDLCSFTGTLLLKKHINAKSYQLAEITMSCVHQCILASGFHRMQNDSNICFTAYDAANIWSILMYLLAKALSGKCILVVQQTDEWSDTVF